MFSKIRSAALALAAVATLGTATLISTTDSADARGFGGGGFSRGGGGGGMGMARMGGGRVHSGGRVHIGHRVHFGHRHIGHRIRIGHHRPHFRPHWCHRWHHHCRVHVRWPRPLLYTAPVIATTYAVAPTVAAPAPRCTCLTKEYTQDGLVVFKDVCTKEVASAPVGNTQVQLQLPAQQQEQAPAQQ
ncbi:MAG TPA: hypothetical protein VJT13_24975 [Xanthobacteraceae bacterium]|nr:hypothetical protein [Xanthobacteraceae bacterium]